mgnify:CR=1 FL=1
MFRVEAGSTGGSTPTSPPWPTSPLADQVTIDPLSVPLPEPVTLAKRQVSFGYTFEDQRILMAPMARDGNEGVGSMWTAEAPAGFELLHLAVDPALQDRLRAHPDDVKAFVEETLRYETPVLHQRIDTQATRAANAGVEGTGEIVGYRGIPTLAITDATSSPILNPAAIWLAASSAPKISRTSPDSISLTNSLPTTEIAAAPVAPHAATSASRPSGRLAAVICGRKDSKVASGGM